jgi:hypothetical protein
MGLLPGRQHDLARRHLRRGQFQLAARIDAAIDHDKQRLSIREAAERFAQCCAGPSY